jgi:hypothetical protein
VHPSGRHRRESGDGVSDTTEEGRRGRDSVSQKRTHGELPDEVRPTKKSSTPVTSDTTTDMLFVLPCQPKVQPRMGLGVVT